MAFAHLLSVAVDESRWSLNEFLMPPTDSSIPSPSLSSCSVYSDARRILLQLQLQLELCIPCNSLVICVSLLAAAQPKSREEPCQKYFRCFFWHFLSRSSSPFSLCSLVLLFVLFVTSDADVILLKEHTNKLKERDKQEQE